MTLEVPFKNAAFCSRMPRSKRSRSVMGMYTFTSCFSSPLRRNRGLGSSSGHPNRGLDTEAPNICGKLGSMPVRRFLGGVVHSTRVSIHTSLGPTPPQRGSPCSLLHTDADNSCRPTRLVVMGGRSGPRSDHALPRCPVDETQVHGRQDGEETEEISRRGRGLRRYTTLVWRQRRGGIP